MDEQIANIEPKLWNTIRTMTRSKSEVRGTTKLDDPTSQAHTELSLPQDYGPHRSLSPSDCWPHRALSLSVYGPHRALSPSDCWPHRALSPSDYGPHRVLCPSDCWPHRALSPSDCWLHRALSLSQTAGCTELSLPHSFLYHVHPTGSSSYESTCLFNNSTAYIPQNGT